MEEITKTERLARAVALGWVAAAAALAALLAPTVLWAAPGGSPWEHALADLDGNQDGVVSREEFEQRADPFARLDANGDGVLSPDDKAGGRGFGRPPRGTGVASFVGVADADRDGAVTAEEWRTHLDNLNSIFAELDQDGDGMVSNDELPPSHGPWSHGLRGPGKNRRTGRHGGDPGAMAGVMLLRVADANQDGEVTNGEWRGLLDSLEADADGAISEASLRAVLPERGGHPRGPDRVARLTRLLDRDADGLLEIDDLQAAFAEVDQDGDGALMGEEVPRFRHPFQHRGGGPPRF